MTDISSLKEAARIVYDETGQPVVQIPLALWQKWVTQLEPENVQVQQINALLHAWAEEPEDTPEGWWDDFRQFLKETPLNLESSHDFTDD